MNELWYNFFVKFIKKLLKIIIALALIPFCIGGFWTLWNVILSTGKAEMIWTVTVSGIVCWVLIFIFLPEPKWLYVLGHELTHAIWALPFGGKLKKIRVSSGGGHVLVTKSNFLTSLAPYFFPFYVILVIIIFVIGNFIWGWGKFILFFYFFIGVAYAFHLTLTYKILKIKQPDIVGQGYLFSAVIILIGNILILLIGIPLLTKNINISYALDLWLSKASQVYIYLGHLINI